MQKVLVLGGTYYVGRVFVICTSGEEYRMTLINRGRYSMTRYPHVAEHCCDRRNMEQIRTLPLEEYYDAVVDFCAYEPGDIRMLTENIPCGFTRYIYISTADVHQRNGQVRNEQTPLVNGYESGETANYIYKKMLLEKELSEAAERKKFSYTILRPAFIYGPYNYAPRESFYIEKIYRGRPLPIPEDADGRFQMVYVKDVARAILLCMQKKEAKNREYVLSAPEILDYQRFAEILKEISPIPLQLQELSVDEVKRQKLPLPYPLTREEDELFCGERIVKELGFSYIGTTEGMKLTFDSLRNVYGQNRKT